jgi:hypothetical protein
MFVLPFTKKARARDATLEELRPLLAMRGVPESFWELPHGVGFIIGYATAVAMEVTEDKASDNFVSEVVSGVLKGLVGSVEATLPVARRFATWKNNAKFVEGRKNGNFFALFMHGSEKADATPLAAEAFKQARERAPVFDQLREKTNERGRAAMILCDALFFDQIFETPVSKGREVHVTFPAAAPRTDQALDAPTSSYSKLRAGLEADGSEIGAKTIAAFEVERSKGNINDATEAEIFATAFNEDLKAMGKDITIKHIIEASIHAGIAVKHATKQIAESQMRAELEAARGKFVEQDIAEAELFAQSLGELADRGELTVKDYMEAKIFAKFLSRARAKVRAEHEANAFARGRPSYRVGAQNAQKLPFSHGTIWLEPNEILFSFPSKDFSLGGRAYHIPGGAMCFQRDPNGRKALLKYLQSERDFWAPGNEAEWVKRAEPFSSK